MKHEFKQSDNFVLVFCHGHEKLQEQELNQGHNKENKLQEMQT
jgi:hypothetical protein